MVGHTFRIIVVGGGPIGLLAAHILSKAGIDYVLLEKQATVAPELGNALALWPQTTRILDQLRLLEPLQPLLTPVNHRILLTHDGKIFSRSKMFYLTRET